MVIIVLVTLCNFGSQNITLSEITFCLSLMMSKKAVCLRLMQEFNYVIPTSEGNRRDGDSRIDMRSHSKIPISGVMMIIGSPRRKELLKWPESGVNDEGALPKFLPSVLVGRGKQLLGK